jgi:small-conductance mechanosensitive channel
VSDDTAGAGSPATSAAASADVIVHNRRIIAFRAPLGALSAFERAEAARRRIEMLSEADHADTVALRAIPEGVLLTARQRGILTITPADIDTIVGETLEEAGAKAARQLELALAEMREERSFAHLVRAIGMSIVATLILLFGLGLLYRGRSRVLSIIPAAAGKGIPRIMVGGFPLLDPRQVLTLLRGGVELLSIALSLVFTYLWLTFVLTRFSYSRPWGEALGDHLISILLQLIRGAIDALPALLSVIVIFIITRWFARLVASFFAAVERGDISPPWVHADTAQPTRRIVVALLWLFAIIVAYPYLPGSDTAAFKGVSIFVGLVLSLGSTGLVNQAMSGLVLMYARAVRAGDYVRIGDVEGVVTALGMLSTKVRTTKWEEVTLPNAVVVSMATMNYTRLAGVQGLVLHTSVTIGYDVPWRQVQALLIMAAGRTPGLRRKPDPFVLQLALSDFYVEYQLNAYADHPEERILILSALHANILDCFNEYGVQILSPHFEREPTRPALVPGERWYAPPAPAPAPASGEASRNPESP